jgi:uncharacterized damage-inducible protein DinB
MEMKQYLIDTFRYNDYANKLALRKMRELPEKDESIKWFSHLINSMNKWLARIHLTPGYAEMDWFKPVYELDELEAKWDECLEPWIAFLESKSDEELEQEVEWCNPQLAAPAENHPVGEAPTPLLRKEGSLKANFAAKIVDIALQLNYHSIHHRAQIQYLIRQQGVEPEFVDYIGTKYRRL